MESHAVCRSTICAGSCGGATGPFSLKRSTPPSSPSTQSTPAQSTPDEAAPAAPAAPAPVHKRQRFAVLACTRLTDDGAVCGKLFPDSWKLLQHTKAVHDKVKDFPCPVKGCDFAASQQARLKQHVQTVHEKRKDFPCPVKGCDFAASQKAHLKRHVQTVHEKRKDFPCPVEGCDFAASRASNLKQHVQTVHEKRKDFKCPVEGCDFAVSQKAHLKLHVQTVHEKRKDFKCPVKGCDFAASRASKLKQHVQTVHEKIRNFPCPVQGCGFAASRASHLQLHMLIHTNEFPHPCEVAGCGAKFRQAGHLKNHTYFYHTLEGNAARKQRETAIEKLLTEHGFLFQREHRIDLKCALPGATNVRADFILLFQNTVVILEVDQFQHDGYGVACDLRRMTDTVASLRIGGNTMRVVFVRYNPDGFKVAGRTKPTTRAKRHERLVSVLRTLESEPVADATLCDTRIWYLFYDVEADGKPTIFQDESYVDAVKEWLVKAYTD